MICEIRDQLPHELGFGYLATERWFRAIMAVTVASSTTMDIEQWNSPKFPKLSDFR
jgi:hypothetical protein